MEDKLKACIAPLSDGERVQEFLMKKGLDCMEAVAYAWDDAAEILAECRQNDLGGQMIALWKRVLAEVEGAVSRDAKLLASGVMAKSQPKELTMQFALTVAKSKSIPQRKRARKPQDEMAVFEIKHARITEMNRSPG